MFTDAGRNCVGDRPLTRIEGREWSASDDDDGGERCARRYVWGWRRANWDGGRESAEAVLCAGEEEGGGAAAVAEAIVGKRRGVRWEELGL